MGLEREIRVVFVFLFNILLLVAKITPPIEGLSRECSCCWRWQNLYKYKQKNSKSASTNYGKGDNN